MQHTFQIKTERLNSRFIEAVRAIFGNREVKIVVEDVDEDQPLSQKELYRRSLAAMERFRNVKVDPQLDLSALANEVNL